jgi:hypothetical protein
VTHEDLVDLMELMESKGAGPKSIRNYLGTLSAIFNFAKVPRQSWWPRRSVGVMGSR